MMELLFSRLMAAVAAALLIACALAVFTQVQGENEEGALKREAEVIALAFSSVPTEGRGSVTFHGKEMLPLGHQVALIGSILVLRADGLAFPIANLSSVQNEIPGEWTCASDLRLCWSEEGTYIYLLNESASLSTAAASRLQSSFVL